MMMGEDTIELFRRRMAVLMVTAECGVIVFVLGGDDGEFGKAVENSVMS